MENSVGFDADQHWSDEIAPVRRQLRDDLEQAVVLAQRAALAIARLRSDAVHDKAYVEGFVGEDLAAFIASARRSLTAARLLVL